MRRWQRSNQITCKTKWTYRNKAQAVHYALLLKQVPYKCLACDRWHLTTRGL